MLSQARQPASFDHSSRRNAVGVRGALVYICLRTGSAGDRRRLSLRSERFALYWRSEAIPAQGRPCLSLPSRLSIVRRSASIAVSRLYLRNQAA